MKMAKASRLLSLTATLLVLTTLPLPLPVQAPTLPLPVQASPPTSAPKTAPVPYYVYRVPDWRTLAPYELRSWTPAAEFAARNAYLDAYAQQLYLGSVGTIQRVPITPQTMYHAHFDWHIEGVSRQDVLAYTNQVMMARWLYRQGYTVELLVEGNADSSTVDPSHEWQPFGYNRPLSGPGVGMMARSIKQLVGAVTEGTYSTRVSVIYGNEPDLLDLQANRPIISATEYYANLHDLRDAVRALGLPTVIHGAALSAGWDDPLVGGTNRMRTWLRAALRVDDEVDVNLYPQNLTALQHQYNSIMQYIGRPVRVRVQELGILQGNEVWKAWELGRMMTYLRGYTGEVEEVAVYPYT